MADIAGSFKNALLSSDKDTAAALMEDYLAEKTSFEFVEDIMIKVLDEVGDGWYKGRYALSQIYMSGRICEDLMEMVLPDESGLRKTKPRIAIALLNDYHALGKRIVYAVLRAGGFHLLDYGRVENADLVRRAEEDNIEVLLISVLMLSSAVQVKEVVKNLSSRGSKIKIVVGGAPFRLDPQLWQEVGANAVGYTATDALHLVGQMEGKASNE
ncbi:MAG: cobalamin-dependent protein [Bacillota bacterium]|nr:cobalamin-dependent protein [Bacillota bacterium]